MTNILRENSAIYSKQLTVNLFAVHALLKLPRCTALSSSEDLKYISYWEEGRLKRLSECISSNNAFSRVVMFIWRIHYVLILVSRGPQSGFQLSVQRKWSGKWYGFDFTTIWDWLSSSIGKVIQDDLVWVSVYEAQLKTALFKWLLDF